MSFITQDKAEADAANSGLVADSSFLVVPAILAKNSFGGNAIQAINSFIPQPGVPNDVQGGVPIYARTTDTRGSLAVINAVNLATLTPSNTANVAAGVYASSRGVGVRGVSDPYKYANYQSDIYSIGVYGTGYTGVKGGGMPGGSGDTGTIIGVSGTGATKGVYGEATDTTGTISAPTCGVHAKANVTGVANVYALLAEGDAAVSGNLTKGGGAFRIDHPLCPTEKFLQHSFVESPDAKNVYDGTVIADQTGCASVQMPDWFDALNEEFRYQLTPIGQPAPELHVASELLGGRFVIAGARPGQKISWQVTGVRKDPYAKTYPLAVEQEKAPHERGTYLHPEAYGQPRVRRDKPSPNVAKRVEGTEPQS